MKLIVVLIKQLMPSLENGFYFLFVVISRLDAIWGRKTSGLIFLYSRLCIVELGPSINELQC